MGALAEAGCMCLCDLPIEFVAFLQICHSCSPAAAGGAGSLAAEGSSSTAANKQMPNMISSPYVQPCF
jgi:hypothetical protein